MIVPRTEIHLNKHLKIFKCTSVVEPRLLRRGQRDVRAAAMRAVKQLTPLGLYIQFNDFLLLTLAIARHDLCFPDKSAHIFAFCPLSFWRTVGTLTLPPCATCDTLRENK